MTDTAERAKALYVESASLFRQAVNKMPLSIDFS